MAKKIITKNEKLEFASIFRAVVRNTIKNLEFKQNDICVILNISKSYLSNLMIDDGDDKKILKRHKSREKYFKILLEHLESQKLIKENSIKEGEININWVEQSPSINHVYGNIIKILEFAIQSNAKTLRILDTWLSYFQPQQDVIFQKMIIKFEKIEILVLNPLSPLLKYRVDDLDNIEITYEKVLDEAKSAIKKIFKKSKERTLKCKIELRLYDCLPGTNCVITEKVIYSRPFLSKRYDGLFQKVENNANKVADEINSHFNSLWDKGKELIESDIHSLDETVNNLIVNQIIKPKDYLKFLRSEYSLYNLDEDLNHPFQKSKIEIIDNNNLDCKLIYEERESSLTKECLGKINHVGQNNLLLTFQEGRSFFLSILVYLESKILESPEVIQVVYIHSDVKTKPRSVLGLLVDATKYPPNYINTKPVKAISRKQEDIDIDIQKFLYRKKDNIIQLESGINKYADLVEGEDKNEILGNLTGTWRAVYPNRFSGNEDETIDNDYYLSSLGVGKLEIYQYLGEFKVRFTTENEIINGIANIISIKKGSNYLKIELTEPDLNTTENFYIHLILWIKGNGIIKTLTGTFNIIYPNKDTNGVGLVEIKKINKNIDKVQPRSVDFQKEYNFDNLDLTTVKRLVFKRDASIIWNKKVSKRTSKEFQFSGLYKVYTHGLIGDKSDAGLSPLIKSITSGILMLGENLVVKFRGTHKGDISFGKVFRYRNNLFIELSSKGKDGEDRLGYFIIAARGEKPKKDSVYSGIFLGLSGTDHYPLAKRVIFEYVKNKNEKKYFKEFDCKRMVLYGPDYDKLQEEIKGILSGRIPNYIGFQKAGPPPITWKEFAKYKKLRVDMGEVFAYYAIGKILHGRGKVDYYEADKAIQRAVEHGFKDIDFFKDVLKKHLSDDDIKKYFQNYCVLKSSKVFNYEKE